MSLLENTERYQQRLQTPKHTFYNDIPDPPEHIEWMEALDKLPGYTYHLDETNHTIVQERMYEK